jgi:peptide/nickel transport system substrate-binding protein
MSKSGLDINQAISRRAFITRVLTNATVLALAGCTASGTTSQPTPQTNTVAPSGSAAPPSSLGRILKIGQPQDLNPANAPFVLNGAVSADFTSMYDTLLWYDRELQPRPRLATSWQWSENFDLLTLKLRDDVKFHTGRRFTSADAKFNLEAVRDLALGSQWLNYAKEMQIETPDPATLVIHYPGPRKSSFDALAGTFMADPQTLDQTRTGSNFVGTGPFRFKEWAPGDHLTVVRNPDYWQAGKPYIDEIDLQIVADAQSGVVRLESGAVDWLRGVPEHDAARLQSAQGYDVLLSANGSSFWYLGLDVSVPALADKRVRQAFAYALDRSRIVDSVLFGFGRPASIVWPRQSLAYDTSQDQTYSHDLGKARQLLEAAGWDEATVVKLTVPSTVPQAQQMAEILQQDLTSIGLHTSIQKVAPAVLSDDLLGGKFDGAWLTSMGFMNQSPATFFMSAIPMRVPNPSHFDSPRYRNLLNQTSTAIDDNMLRSVLKELNQITLDEAFVVPISENFGVVPGMDVIRRTVTNVTWDVRGWYALEDVSLQA